MSVKPFIAAAVVAAVALQPVSTTADPSAIRAPAFSAAEIEKIIAHGPWPAPWTKDPSNRVSGKLEAVEFGTHLFFDTRLSGTGSVSCGTCHVPERNWTDNQTRSVGVAALDRNTPTLMNVRLGHWFGWEGGADSLWSQSIRPILDARELGSNAKHVANLVRKDDQLACRYRKTFGHDPSPNHDESILVDVGKALAAFQETLQSGRTPFDEYRDALQRGAPLSEWRYSEPARRGLRIFIGKGGCSECHSGPNFASDQFHDMGVGRKGENGRAALGRDTGLTEVRKSPYNLLGVFSDDRSHSSATHTRQAAAEKPAPGAVKVPSLRNLVLTAPYGHTGEITSIADVVRHHSERGLRLAGAGPGEARTPLALSAGEQNDLVVFLESLSTFTNPWRPDDGGRCE